MLEKNKNQDFDLTLFFFIFSNPEYSYDLQSVNAKNNERNKKIAFLKLYQTILPNHELTIIWLSKIGKELNENDSEFFIFEILYDYSRLSNKLRATFIMFRVFFTRLHSHQIGYVY